MQISPYILTSITHIPDHPTIDRALARQLAGLTDLTSLNDGDTEETIAKLCREARSPLGDVAGVCVWPQFVKQVRRALGDAPVRVVTVVNFPDGTSTPADIRQTTRQALLDGATEIDIVLPYQAYLAGDRSTALEPLKICREACSDLADMKVILETGAFDDPAVLSQASHDAIACGARFLKTSTGKREPGASLEVAALLLSVIRESWETVGLKVSGGVSAPEDAARYYYLAAHMMSPEWVDASTFRIGSSKLIANLSARFDGGAPKAAA